MELEALYGQAFTFTVPLIDTIRAPIFLKAVTFSTGDAKINWGGGAFTNLQNLPSHIAAGMFAVGLTATELAGKRMAIVLNRTSHGLWFDQAILIKTINTLGADIPSVTASFGQMPAVNVSQWLGSAPNVLQASRVDSYIGAYASALDFGNTQRAAIKAVTDTSLIEYDPPTNAELTGVSNTLQADHALLNNLSQAEARAAADSALTAYNGPTHAELISEIDDVQTDIGALNNLTQAQVRAAADSAVHAYDAMLLTDAPSNWAAMGIEADGHVHADVKEWLGVAPTALTNGNVAADVKRWLAVAPAALVATRVDARMGAVLNSAANVVADHVMRRQWGAVTDGDAEDDRSILGMVAQQVNKVAFSGGSLLVLRDDDATVFVSKPVIQTSGAVPVIEINPPGGG